MKKVLVTMLAVAVLATGASAAIYTEDFEGGSPTEDISNYGWSAGLAGSAVDIVASTNVGNSASVDGSTSSATGVTATFYEGIGQSITSADDALYTFTVDAYAVKNGVQNCAVGLGSGSGGWSVVRVGWWANTDHWTLDLRQLNDPISGQESLSDDFGFDKDVVLTIYIDTVADEVWGSVYDGSTTETTAKYGINNYGTLDSVGIYLEHATANLDIDNINLVVPEPATMTLLGIGGIGLLIRKRR